MSEGSHPRANNPHKAEKQSELSQISPAETDHKFESSKQIDNQILEDSPEMLRRKNNRNRDYRTGNRITNNGIYANPVSPSGKS